MNNKALGIIETYGFVPAVAGADAALKSAAVELLGCRSIGSGLVSVLLLGDVSSVKVAVDSGCCAADQVGSVRWCTVIARTAEGLDSLVADAQPGVENTPNVAKDESKLRSEAGAVVVETNAEISLQRLYGLHVKELRGLARQLTGLSLDRPQIRSARKDELIAAIVSYYQQQKETADGR